MRFIQSILFAFLLSNIGFASLTTKDLNKICCKKDYNYLINELNKFEQESPSRNKIRWYMPQNRETISGYFEQVFQVIQDDRTSSKGTVVHTFKISFIRQRTKIIFYKIEGAKTKKNSPTIYNYTYSTKRRFFKFWKHNRVYKYTYKHKLDRNKLFNLDNTFGYKCGSTQAKTYLIDSIESITDTISWSSVQILRQMLRDENVEMQLYGYFGFHRLQHLGYRYDFVDEKLVSLLVNKQGSVAYCNLMDNKQVEISYVISEVKALSFPISK